MQHYYAAESTDVKLDTYICDLNLEITNGGYGCVPKSNEGFTYMWAGSKATYGIRNGKVCFEVKVAGYNEVSNKENNDTHVARVGWSTDSATLQLGEDDNSFGFGGTGKKSVNRKFLNYGRRYEKGDVVGCYLSMENGWVDIAFSVNGRFCGSAYKIRWMTDEALFPHVLTKNCRLEVNFGQAPHPYFSLQPGFKLLGHVPPEFRVPAVRSPPNQADCEIIMMVGLPGVGKTTWAMNYAKIHPSKKYVVLGTDSIIDKMRVMGLPRKNNFSGRWEQLIKQATDCFNVLLKKASNLPRNLILDQTNVYASARRRKVKQYRDKGYMVNCMVLVPRDEDMVRRSDQRTRDEGKEVPEAAVLDMKANFSLPDEQEQLFDNITFLELQRNAAQGLVEQYNAEAAKKGHRSNQKRRSGMNQNQTERNAHDKFAPKKPDTSFQQEQKHNTNPSMQPVQPDSKDNKAPAPGQYGSGYYEQGGYADANRGASQYQDGFSGQSYGADNSHRGWGDTYPQQAPAKPKQLGHPSQHHVQQEPHHGGWGYDNAAVQNDYHGQQQQQHQQQLYPNVKTEPPYGAVKSEPQTAYGIYKESEQTQQRAPEAWEAQRGHDTHSASGRQDQYSGYYGQEDPDAAASMQTDSAYNAQQQHHSDPYSSAQYAPQRKQQPPPASQAADSWQVKQQPYEAARAADGREPWPQQPHQQQQQPYSQQAPQQQPTSHAGRWGEQPYAEQQPPAVRAPPTSQRQAAPHQLPVKEEQSWHHEPTGAVAKSYPGGAQYYDKHAGNQFGQDAYDDKYYNPPAVGSTQGADVYSRPPHPEAAVKHEDSLYAQGYNNSQTTVTSSANYGNYQEYGNYNQPLEQGRQREHPSPAPKDTYGQTPNDPYASKDPYAPLSKGAYAHPETYSSNVSSRFETKQEYNPPVADDMIPPQGSEQHRKYSRGPEVAGAAHQPAKGFSGRSYDEALDPSHPSQQLYQQFIEDDKKQLQFFEQQMSARTGEDRMTHGLDHRGPVSQHELNHRSAPDHRGPAPPDRQHFMDQRAASDASIMDQRGPGIDHRGLGGQDYREPGMNPRGPVQSQRTPVAGERMPPGSDQRGPAHRTGIEAERGFPPRGRPTDPAGLQGGPGLKQRAVPENRGFPADVGGDPDQMYDERGFPLGVDSVSERRDFNANQWRPGLDEHRISQGMGGPERVGPHHRGSGAEDRPHMHGGGPEKLGPGQNTYPGMERRGPPGLATEDRPHMPSGGPEQRGPGPNRHPGMERRGPPGPGTEDRPHMHSGGPEQRGPGQNRQPGMERRGPPGPGFGSDERGLGPNRQSGPAGRGFSPKVEGDPNRRFPGPNNRPPGMDERGLPAGDRHRHPSPPAPRGPPQLPRRDQRDQQAARPPSHARDEREDQRETSRSKDRKEDKGRSQSRDDGGDRRDRSRKRSRSRSRERRRRDDRRDRDYDRHSSRRSRSPKRSPRRSRSPKSKLRRSPDRSKPERSQERSSSRRDRSPPPANQDARFADKKDAPDPKKARTEQQRPPATTAAEAAKSPRPPVKTTAPTNAAPPKSSQSQEPPKHDNKPKPEPKPVGDADAVSNTLAKVDFDKLKASLANIRRSQGGVPPTAEQVAKDKIAERARLEAAKKEAANKAASAVQDRTPERSSRPQESPKPPQSEQHGKDGGQSKRANPASSPQLTKPLPKSGPVGLNGKPPPPRMPVGSQRPPTADRPPVSGGQRPPLLRPQGAKVAHEEAARRPLMHHHPEEEARPRHGGEPRMLLQPKLGEPRMPRAGEPRMAHPRPGEPRMLQPRSGEPRPLMAHLRPGEPRQVHPRPMMGLRPSMVQPSHEEAYMMDEADPYHSRLMEGHNAVSRKTLLATPGQQLGAPGMAEEHFEHMEHEEFGAGDYMMAEEEHLPQHHQPQLHRPQLMRGRPLPAGGVRMRAPGAAELHHGAPRMLGAPRFRGPSRPPFAPRQHRPLLRGPPRQVIPPHMRH